MIITYLLFLLFFHSVSEKTLHYYFKNEYKTIYPIITHSFIYSLIFLIPSLLIFKQAEIVFYFILVLMFLHYSVNYFFFYIYNFVNNNYKTYISEIDSYLHIVCLFYSFWWCFNV